MKKWLSANLHYVFIVAAAAVFALLTKSVSSLDYGSAWHRAVIMLIFVLLSLLAVFLLWRYAGKRPASKFLSLAALCILAAMLIRALCMDHITQDYDYFLARWVEHYRTSGGFAGIKDAVGNYNAPYLYFLAAISYSSVPDLYLIKLFSVLFDVLLAWAAMLLVIKLRQKTDFVAVGAFFCVLFFPTVILNGAYWGQCDSIYAFFAVYALYLALDERPWLSVAMLALAFSFKMQAIFIIPAFFALLLAKKIKIRHLTIFPVIFVALLIPALLLGKPAADTFGVYFGQAAEYSSRLTLNAPSIFTFVRNAESTQPYATIGIIAAFTMVLLVFALLIRKRKSINDRAVFAAALVFCAGIPLLLPYMHERYWFMADVLVVVLAFCKPRYAGGVIVMLAGSFSGYHAYLALKYAYDMRIGTCCIIGIFVLAVVELILALTEQDGRRITRLPD